LVLLKPIANILIIDDEADIAKTMKDGLILSGFEATAFTDPGKALEHLREHSKEFCAVVSDIRMPNISGFQIARAVKATNPDLKVILMSAFSINQKEFAMVMPSTQVDEFVEKPTSIREIKDVLLKHVGQTKQLTGGR